jgi:LacI family transcriptional regulator
MHERRKAMSIGIKDIALQTNVSATTVSQALRGRGRISRKTRERIMVATKELGFYPNFAARSLVTGRSDVLGIVIRDIQSLNTPYVAGIVSGIVDVCDDNEMSILFARSSYRKYEEPEYLRFAREKRVAGAIIIDQRAGVEDLKKLETMAVPVVLIDRKSPRLKFPVVRINDTDAVKRAVSHLVDLGHRHMAVISGDPVLFDYEEKLRGFHQALSERHLLPDENHIGIYGKGADDNMLAWLENFLGRMLQTDNRPTAVLCFIDNIVPVVCDLIREFGYKIPGDITVVSFHNSESTIDGLSVDRIQIPSNEMGKRACQLMLDLMKGRATTKEVILETTFEAAARSDKCVLT